MVLAVTLAVVVALSAFVSDDVIEAPGSASPTLQLLAVPGATPPAPGQGQFLLLSVSSHRATLLESFLERYSDAVEVVGRRTYLGPCTDDAARQRSGTAAMDQSQARAVAVALRAAGKTFEQRPTGARILGILGESNACGVLAAGDLITAVDGRLVESPQVLRDAIGRHRVGDEIEVRYRRGEEERTTRVRLIADPDDGHPLVGITSQVEYDFSFPLDIQFPSSGITGPSGGLAFALTVYDAITPGDLAAGRLVAATGEIEVDGTVGPIGGAREKVIAARRAGVDVVMVPPENEADARRGIRDGRPEVVAARTFADALGALRARGGQPPA